MERRGIKGNIIRNLFRAKTDKLYAVYFNLPQTKDFERYWSSTSDPEILNIYRWVKIHTAFNEELPTESAIANQWYDDHSDDNCMRSNL